MDETLLGQAVQAAQQHVPSGLAGLAQSTGFWSDRTLEFLDSEFVFDFRNLMIALRVFATVALLVYGYWFAKKLKKISLDESFDAEEKRQTEMARAMVNNTLWLGNQRGIVPLIWEIWMTLVVTWTLAMGVKFALQNGLLERAVATTAEFADAGLKQLTPEKLQPFVPPVSQVIQHIPMPHQK